MKIVFQSLVIALVVFFRIESFACSMCKVTINGHTYVGNNEDNWKINSRIWFEHATAGKLGCVYVGYDSHPQGGMNEDGLVFDGLATFPKPIKNDPQKKEISNPTDFLKQILQTCKTVKDVKRFVSQYNRQKFFNNGEYLFVDKTGEFLVMEADTLLSGNDDKYLISNFCPSITSEQDKLHFDRYRKGKMFLNNHANDTNANFCYALIDTMHDCRKKIGDGTLYSYVANLDKGEFTLYFYHDFKHPITFNLKKELSKGDHTLEMPQIFPANAEYLKFLNFKIPRNNSFMLLFIFLSGGLFSFTALFFLISFLATKRFATTKKSYSNLKLILAILSLVLLYYMTVLYQHEEVFYYPAPFRDFNFSMLNIAAYIPFLLLVLIFPLIRLNIMTFRSSSWGFFPKSIFVLNNLFYLTLIGLFFYWGLYSIF